MGFIKTQRYEIKMKKAKKNVGAKIFRPYDYDKGLFLCLNIRFLQAEVFLLVNGLEVYADEQCGNTEAGEHHQSPGVVEFVCEGTLWVG